MLPIIVSQVGAGDSLPFGTVAANAVRLVDHLTDRLKRNELNNGDVLYKTLKNCLCEILKDVEVPLTVDTQKSPYVILFVGVNGAGKTTTIGKLAKRLQQDDKTVMLAAGDTFRAAATEQLQAWGERNQIPVVSQHPGADTVRCRH